MINPNRELKVAADLITAHMRRLMDDRNAPFLIALDGGSGSGKSTIASLVGEELGAALIPSDDFFAADITDAEWDLRTPEMRAGGAIDWRRLRREALEPLLAAKPAKWRRFDFEAGALPNGTYRMRTDFVAREPRTVIVLEGAYSCRPELADLIDLSVLIDAPLKVRHERLARREDKTFVNSWHARWDAAEEYYFTKIRPGSSFDLVVATDAMSHQGSDLRR
jgi:uridine kinase